MGIIIINYIEIGNTYTCEVIKSVPRFKSSMFYFKTRGQAEHFAGVKAKLELLEIDNRL